MQHKTKEIVPFLKWAGGKRWLVRDCPELFNTTFDRYIEPFLGSGAVFFNLQPKNAILSDSNKRLIETYLAIKNDWARVSDELKKHHNNHRKNYYYKIRQMKCRS